jgi:hypothetical protein
MLLRAATASSVQLGLRNLRAGRERWTDGLLERPFFNTSYFSIARMRIPG